MTFDRVAERTARLVGSSYFFVGCVVVVLVWLPSYPVFSDVQAWQLPINTFTTVVTFLMVAILENSANRNATATNVKLNAIADALATFMSTGDDDLKKHAQELRETIGLEEPDNPNSG